MKRISFKFRKYMSILVCLFYVLNLFKFNVKGETKEVTLNVSKGNIEIHPTYYTQDNNTKISCDAATTTYIITGSKSSADRILYLTNDGSNNPTYNIVFNNLTISPGRWCSVISFDNYYPSNLIVNLHLKGTNSIAADNHPALYGFGGVILNISAEAGSVSTFDATYSGTNYVLGDMALNKVGNYDITVAGKATPDLNKGKEGKPMIITGLAMLQGTPTISGDKTIGSTLTASHGITSPNPLNIQYSWYRGDISIGSGNTYTVQEADAGQTLTCSVSTSNYGGDIKASVTINKINSNLEVSCEDIVYGESPNPQTTGGHGGKISYFYKKTQDDNSKYSSEIPSAVGNYTIKAIEEATSTHNSGEATTSFTIDAKEITISGLRAQDKVYDGNNLAVISKTSNYSINGRLDSHGPDEVDISGFIDDSTVGTFEDENVRIVDNNIETKNVAVTGLSLTGSQHENYALTLPMGLNAKITPKEINLSGLQAQDKVYDGNNSAVINKTPNYSINGRLSSHGIDELDVVGFVGNSIGGIFENKNVEVVDNNVIRKNVKVIGLSLTGSKHENYTLALPTDLFAKITPKDIGFSIMVPDKNYDGTTSISSQPKATLNTADIIPADLGNVSLLNGTISFENFTIGSHKIVFTGYGLSGSERNNYNLILPEIFATIREGFNPIRGTHYEITSLSDGLDGWYKNNNFIISAKEGYALSKNNTDIGPWSTTISEDSDGSLKEVKFYVRRIGESDADIYKNEISVLTTESYKKDSQGPTGSISVEENKWTSFLNWVTFGYFFKETINISIIAEDSTSGVKSIEYLISEHSYDSENDVISGPWILYESEISIQPEQNKKLSLYAKITDNAGNIKIINTAGIVIYRDSLQDTENILFIKTSESDVNASVHLNGNTIAKITNGDSELVLGRDYNVNGPTITFKSSYLNSILAGNYTMTVYYNPAGEKYIEGTSTGETPDVTTIALEVLKANQVGFKFDNIADSYNYGDSPIILRTINGSGTGNVIYSLVKNDNSVSLSGDTITIFQPGEFIVKAIKSSDDNYNEASIEKTIIINPKLVNILGTTVSNKTYDGNHYASISDIGTIYGKVGLDDLFIDTTKAIALFNDKNVGENKLIIFSGFSLGGVDSYKYSLSSSSPANTYATISPIETTISGVTAENKIYDGATDAVISGTHIVDSKIGSDDVSISIGTASFSSKSIGADKEVIFLGFSLVGNDSLNYHLKSNPQNVKANIIPKEVTIKNIVISNKKYDGMVSATFFGEPNLVGIEKNDEVSLVNGVPQFSSSSIGNDISITFNPEFSIEGLDASNYLLIQPIGITGNIEPGFTPVKDTHYTISEPDGVSSTGDSSNGWYRSADFKIIAQDGYSISTLNINNPENWVKELIYSSETFKNEPMEIEFYIRRIGDSSGDITKGEISVSKKETYKKDKTSPTGEIQIGENRWMNFLNSITFGYFFKDVQEIKIIANDENSGIYSVQYYKSNNHLSKQEVVDLDSNVWTIGLSFSVLPDDKFVVYAKITDNAGNITYISSDGIVINATEPSISVTANFPENTWTNNEDARLNVNITHALPVIDSVSYQIGEENSVDVDISASKNSDSTAPDKVNFVIQNIPDGEYDIIIRTKAKLNIYSQKIFSVKKDIVKPIILGVSIIPDKLTDQNVTVKISATDDRSGIQNEGYSFDGGLSWQTDNFNIYTQNIIIPSNTVKVKDEAGNIINFEQEIMINQVDKLPPQKPIIENVPQDWVNSEVILKVVCQDAERTDLNTESDLSYFEFSIDAGETFTKVNWSDNPTFTINEPGDYTNKILVKVTDNAGNTSELSDFYTVKIDKTAPEIISIIGNPEEWTNQNATLTINAVDNMCGLNVQAYSFDKGLSWQSSPSSVYTHNIKIPSGTIQVRDVSGNISYYEEDININKIDKVAPQTPIIEGASDQWKYEDVILTVVSNDETSNSEYTKSELEYFEFSLDGGRTFEKVNWSKSPTFTITESGDYTDKIFVKVVDKAGNISHLSDPYTVKLDKNESEEFNQVDQSTGVWIHASSGVIPKNSKLIVDQLDQSNEERAKEYKKIYGNLDEKTKETLERCNLFEIHIVDNKGNIIQPEGSAKVGIPIPENFDKTNEDIEIYRVQMGLDDDDDFNEHIKEIDGVYYCVFETDHFSPYALVDKNLQDPKLSSSNIILILFLVAFIFLFILFFVRKVKELY